MNPNASVALDILRLTAALIVFFGHASGMNWTGGFLWQASVLMDAAVVGFFVLSGYVIAYVVEQRELDWRMYFAARVSRIWSVALPALLLTWGIDQIGVRVAPELYIGQPWFNEKYPWLQYFASLLMVHGYWGVNLEPGINLPFWSLCNEAAYYLWFGFLAFLPLRIAVPLTGVGMLLAGPAIVLLFPVWLLGTLVWRVQARALHWRFAWAAFAVASTVLAYILLVRLDLPSAPSILGVKLYTQWAQGVVASLGLLAVIGAVSRLPSINANLRRRIAFWAAPTFALYLLHRPLIQFFAYIYDGPPADLVARVLVIGGSLMVVYCMSPHCDALKRYLHARIDSALSHGRPSNPEAGK